MTQIDKLIEKIIKSKTDIDFSDFRIFLEHYGYCLIRQKGSYFHFRKPDAPFITILVHNKKVKRVYLKEIIKIIKI